MTNGEYYDGTPFLACAPSDNGNTARLYIRPSRRRPGEQCLWIQVVNQAEEQVMIAGLQIADIEEALRVLR